MLFLLSFIRKLGFCCNVREEEFASFFAVDDGYGLYLIENSALFTQTFSVVPIGFGLKEEHLGAVDHSPAAVFEIFFVEFLELFVKNINIFLSVFFAYGINGLSKHAVSWRIPCRMSGAECVYRDFRT